MALRGFDVGGKIFWASLGWLDCTYACFVVPTNTVLYVDFGTSRRSCLMINFHTSIILAPKLETTYLHPKCQGQNLVTAAFYKKN